MKHLKSLSRVFESLEENISLQGFYFCPMRSAGYIGAYPTFTEFANSIMDDYGIEPERKLLTWTDLDNEIISTLEGKEAKDYTSVAFSGLIPREQKEFTSGFDIDNPYLVVSQLDQRFTNAKKLMSSKVQRWTGNDEDLSYIVKSIHSDVSLLHEYLGYPDADIKKYVLRNIDAENIAIGLNGDLEKLYMVYEKIPKQIALEILDYMGISEEEMKRLNFIGKIGLIGDNPDE